MMNRCISTTEVDKSMKRYPCFSPLQKKLAILYTLVALTPGDHNLCKVQAFTLCTTPNKKYTATCFRRQIDLLDVLVLHSSAEVISCEFDQSNPDVEPKAVVNAGLTKDQKEFLSTLSEDIYGRTFLLKLQELLLYKNTNGSCSVPKRYKENPSLGNWVNKTRQMYRKYLNGESSSITKERIQVLNDVGFIWSGTTFLKGSLNHLAREQDSPHDNKPRVVDFDNMRTAKDQLWIDRYETLKEYWSSNNKSYSDLKTSEHSMLSSWIVRQRREYSNLLIGKKSTMTKERIQLLESIDFDWSPRETNWNARIQELIEYKAKYGDCLVPVQYEDNPRLGRWVSTQRKYYKLYLNGNTSRITKEKIKQLTSIGFVWNRWEHNWSDNGCLSL